MAKNTIELLDRISRKRGGRCLGKSSDGCKYKFQCKEGHIWNAIGTNVKRGSWCPKCVGRGITIENAQDFAKSKNGKCLSLKYISSRKPLKWKCSKGHIWNSSFYWAKKTWCRVCNRTDRYVNTFKEMQSIAFERGGRLLSTEYYPEKKLKWKCKNGHIWEAYGYKVKHGNWCADCAGIKKFSIDYLRNFAQKRGGRVISIRYSKASHKMLWECFKGHRWWARFCDIKNNKSWCPFCAGQRISIVDMHKRVKVHKGKCLSNKYVNSKTKLKWKCGLGHIFWRTPASVLRGNFCPECSSLESEKFCRRAFEELFGQKFPKLYPLWLKRYDTGRRLELDGYCEKLKIAFEHNGLQHYKFCKEFHKTKKDFFNQQYKDKIKKQTCKKMGIFLIIIPQLGIKVNGSSSVRQSNLKEFILDELRKKKLPVTC